MGIGTPGRRIVEVTTVRLRTMIHSGAVPPGSRFPPERDLADELGISRTTLREALGVLQADGYLDIRRGQSGGAYVAPLEVAAQLWSRHMTADPAVFNDLIDMRVAVETAAAAFAAQRRDSDDLVRLQTAVDDLSTATGQDAARASDSDFHDGVARAARSPKLAAIAHELRGELFHPIDLLHLQSADARDVLQHAHILDAIRVGDAALAALSMREHVEETRELVRDLLQRTQPDDVPG